MMYSSVLIAHGYLFFSAVDGGREMVITLPPAFYKLAYVHLPSRTREKHTWTYQIWVSSKSTTEKWMWVLESSDQNCQVQSMRNYNCYYRNKWEEPVCPSCWKLRNRMVTKHLQLQVEKGKIKKNNERSLGQLIFWVLYYSLKFNRSVYKGRDQGKWYPETWKWKQENTAGGGVHSCCTAWFTYHILSVALVSELGELGSTLPLG